MNPRYLILLALLFGGCSLTEHDATNDAMQSSQSEQSPSSSAAADSSQPATSLARARMLWKEAGLGSYKFTQQRHCYCRREYTQPIAVVVQDGQIASATYEDGEPVSEGVRKTVRSIDGWLDYIATRQLNNPYEFVAIFDSQYGYPIRYSVDQRQGVADDTEEVMFRSFSALP